MALTLATGSAKAALKLRKDDLYETPTVATKALLAHEPLPHIIWEPACGRGAISRVLHAAGHRVMSQDLVDYGFGESRRDFLMETEAPALVRLTGAIVTNPPFKLAGEFAAKALDLGVPKVVMLCRLAFLESERRSSILDGGKLARVLLFRNRLPFMHRDGYDGPKNSDSGMPFGWFIWLSDYDGPTMIKRISWEKS